MTAMALGLDWLGKELNKESLDVRKFKLKMYSSIN